ncbi:MAG: hypothetical protein IJH87_04165, partial [Atopobiaceae bacterium]|nr:hypothetical protein [Atopobiaceae bacterium]
MPRITDGNRLYLYQLLMGTVGFGVQLPFGDIEDALAQDDILPCDLGFDSIDKLLEACPEFIKITTFKKGRVFATLLVNDEYDSYLEQAAQSSGKREKKADANRPWKRKGSAKIPSPAKPRPNRPAASKNENEEEAVLELDPVQLSESEPQGNAFEQANQAAAGDASGIGTDDDSPISDPDVPEEGVPNAGEASEDGTAVSEDLVPETPIYKTAAKRHVIQNTSVFEMPFEDEEDGTDAADVGSSPENDS